MDISIVCNGLSKYYISVLKRLRFEKYPILVKCNICIAPLNNSSTIML